MTQDVEEVCTPLLAARSAHQEPSGTRWDWHVDSERSTSSPGLLGQE